MKSKFYTKTAGDFIEGNGIGNTPNTELYYLKDAIQTTTGVKLIYVVLNPSIALKNEIETKGSTAFEKNPFVAEASAFVSTADGMVMSSTIAAEKNITVMTKEDALLTTNLVKIDVQRNVAKVAVTYKSDIYSNGGVSFTNGKATALMFGMATTAKQSYFVQQLVSGTDRTVANVLTPGYNVTPTLVNDNWTNFSVLPTEFKNVNSSLTANNQLEGFYVLENVNSTKVNGNTTSAIIKANIIPTAGSVVKVYDITTGLVTSKGDYTPT